VEGIVVNKDEDSGIEVVIRVDVSSWLEPNKVALLRSRSILAPSGTQRIIPTDNSDAVVRG
jgi:hypothetical protein